MNRELRIFAIFLGVFLFAYFVPLATPQFAVDVNPVAAKVTGAIIEAFVLLQWYARNHTLACVIPALFIAGAITTADPIVIRWRIRGRIPRGLNP